MDQLQNIALNATTSFNNREYEKSYQFFNELKSITTSNNKEVLMNLSITEYYMNNCSNPNKLIDELTRINQLPTSTTPSTGNSTTTNNNNNNNNNSTPTEQSTSPAPTSPKEGDSDRSTPPTASTPNDNNLVDLDKDQALIIYNQAVLYNATKQYGLAHSNLETLYQNILFLDDYVAIRICFLMVNVNITLQLYDKAYSVLSYLEQNFSHLYYNKDTDEQHLPTTPTHKDSTTTTTTSEPNSINSSTNSNSSNDSDDLNSQSSWSNTLMSPIEFRFMIHFYKSKLYLLSNDHFHLAKDEINHAITRATKINYKLLPSCYLLKSNYYHISSNTAKTVQFLQQARDSVTNNSTSSNNNNNSSTTPNNNINLSSSSTTTTNSSTPSTTEDNGIMINPLSFGIDLQVEEITPQIFYNDLGCLHFNLHRYTPSIFYFTKSLQEESTTNSNPNNVNLDRRTEIFYNTGILLLLTGRPELAFSCLQEACLVLYNNPLVWLRLAECCILVHTQKSNEESSPQGISLIGDNNNTSGRRVLLPTTSGLHQGLQIEDSDVQSTLGEESNESARIGTLSLEFAAKCLRNAHYLHSKSMKNLKQIKQNSNSKSTTNSPPSSTPLTSANSNNNNNNNSSLSTNPNISDLYHSNSGELMMNVLTSMAYVALCTSNPVVALTSTKELLHLCEENPNQSIVEKFKYYGHMYAAEACIMMNCPSQAIVYLSPNFVDSIKDTSFQSKLYSNPIINSINSNDYRIVFYINLAIAYLLKDDFENANNCIATLMHEQQINNNNHLTNITKISLLKVYIEIRKGNIENALAILSRERPLPIIQE
ncbi:putative CCR4-NOT complex subunit 10 [Heterostelium album PN500]|uniref:Putative CCR4-NOT complex subunit 10 n=1 Tax=Heterostelium pallidum (strain ATCC 26659 / Pp 5 / PN500) TaxID=670386 RepID=D3BGB0_HETP5|nr:putative CCR4-NOT complex subunit 10 [Heterostelium album PN500]EFA79510.1 putative CCR4-NOT complex subunit 10 [Heterostelium album PN500]|eukprot:XP_020431631.1 putative CCR4-NOT complex subunit 10 [Heterostelium album PN500]